MELRPHPFRMTSQPPKDLRLINAYASSKRFALAQEQNLIAQMHNVRNPSAAFGLLGNEIRKAGPIVIHLRMGAVDPLRALLET